MNKVQSLLDDNVSEVFPGGSVVKNPPAMQETPETWFESLGPEDPLE